MEAMVTALALVGMVAAQTWNLIYRQTRQEAAREARLAHDDVFYFEDIEDED